MMTKTKSKQIKQLKYLLLVPVLASMLLYTSCSNTPEKINNAVKQKTTIYKSSNEKLISEIVNSQTTTYLDIYFGNTLPNTKELSVSDLLEEEKQEFLKLKEHLVNNSNIRLRLFESDTERKMIFVEVLNTNRLKNTEVVPFSVVEKAPTFPNCNEGDKDCLNKSMRNFVVENFKAELAKNLGLSAGEKRIFIQFKIDKNGDVTDIKARAPHPKLKEEAIRIAKALPKLIPAEQKGKKVSVGYTLPITFNVE